MPCLLRYRDGHQVTNLLRGDSDNSTRKRAIAGQSTAVILTSQEPGSEAAPPLMPEHHPVRDEGGRRFKSCHSDQLS